MSDEPTLGGLIKPAVPGLNRIEPTKPEDIVAAVTQHEYPDPVPADLLIAVDIESLALGVRPVITQVAMLGYDLNEDEYLETRFVEYFPIDPQLAINPPRKIQGGTLGFWADQPPEALSRIKFSTATDFEDLAVLGRGLIRTFNQMTDNGQKNYEIQAKGPQFDIAAIETLLGELGLEVPWEYDRVTDLRTDLRRARLNPKNIPTPKGFIKHVAYWDARYQIDLHLACKRVFATQGS